MNERAAEVNRTSIPVQSQRQDEKQTNRTPSHNRCKSFRFAFLEVASDTVSGLKFTDFAVWRAFSAKNPSPGKNSSFRDRHVNFKPRPIFLKTCNLFRSSLHPPHNVLRSVRHCSFIRERVGVRGGDFQGEWGRKQTTFRKDPSTWFDKVSSTLFPIITKPIGRRSIPT